MNLVRQQELNDALLQIDSKTTFLQKRIKLPINPNTEFHVRVHHLWHGVKCVHFQDIGDIQALLDANNSLLTNFSHEIKTPLTLIQGYTDIIEERTGQEKKRLQRIRELVARINAISSNAIRTMRQAQNLDNLTVDHVEVDVKEWCEEYLEECRSAG